MLTQEEINKIRQDAGVSPIGQKITPSLSSRLGISVSPKIEKLTQEAETARLEAERAGSFGGMAKEFGKQFGKQAGEISGISPTGRRIAAGIAPYVVPEEELPTVVEELVGGVTGKKKIGVTGELAKKIGLPESVAEGIDVAIDLPLISLGLSKNISKFLGEQAGKSAPELAKILNKPLTEFLPEGLKKVGQIDIGKPIQETAEKIEKFLGKKIEASRVLKIEKINKQTDEIVGRIIQGKPEDISQAKRALSSIDTQGVKTFKDLKETMENKTASLASKLDDYLDEQDLQLGNLKSSELAIETKVGERTIRQDFISDSLKQLNELYKTIKDAPAQARILDLHKKLTAEGLTRKELNNLAREYGREFGNKAFSKMGEPLTSVNAQAFENTRKGIKKTVRQNIEGDVAQTLDEQMSDLIETERLVGKMEEKVNTLFQKVKKRGILEKGARKLADVVNLATFNTIHGFISRMLPSNVGLKTMNSLDIQEELGKNLIKIDNLLKTADDKTLLEGLIDFIKHPKAGMSIEDVSKKGENFLPKITDDFAQEAQKYKSAEEFVKAEFNKKPAYGMSHRPSWEGMPPSHNLLEGETLPRDVYTHPDFSISTGRIRRGDKAANESWSALQKIKGKPDAEITVYRAGKADKLNTGDWVSFSKDYAKQSLEGDIEKVYSFKVKARDVIFAGDDINEFGYYPKSQLTDIWNKANK